MFSKISWTDYLTGMALVIGGYYIVVIALFYRQEILVWLTGKRNYPKPSHQEDNPSFEGLEEVVTDVRSILEKAGGEADKSVLLEQLKSRLANFAGLRQPAFRIAISNDIITQSQEFCGVTFEVEELEAVWETLSR